MKQIKKTKKKTPAETRVFLKISNHFLNVRLTAHAMASWVLYGIILLRASINHSA